MCAGGRCGWGSSTRATLRRGGQRPHRSLAGSGAGPARCSSGGKKAEAGSGKQAGVPAELADRLKTLERENLELRQRNEILRKASVYLAQAELDRLIRR